MKVTFQFSGPKVVSRIERLRKGRPAAQFLKDCLLAGLLLAEDREKPRQPPVPLERARPEFKGLDFSLIAEAVKAQDRQSPVYREVTRLVKLYAPVLKARASALKPAGTLRLDVRCPIEKVAADLTFHALRAVKPPANMTLH